MITIIKRATRFILETNGYYLRQRIALPYGVDYMLDIARLANAWNLPIRTFFDVGANDGETSTVALMQFKQASVYAFEPTKETFEKLLQNVQNKRFFPYRTALGDRIANVPFYQYGACWNNSLVPNPPHYVLSDGRIARVVEVPCTTIDAFCEEHIISGIDVLKVDAERCDLMVLRGAKGVLAQKIRFVYCEFNSVLPTIGEEDSTLCSISEFLFSFGFRFVATYIDRIEVNPMFLVANALFAKPPAYAPH
jgi:FkbM family methyltransferase